MRPGNRDLLAEWRGALREMGVVGGCGYKIDRLLSRMSRGRVRLWMMCLYAQPVPSRPLLAPVRQPRLRIGVVAPGEIPAREFRRSEAAIESRFRQGSICIAGRTDEGMAGYLWLHFGRLPERMFACDFEALPANRTCWDYDLEIEPRYRLGRTFARLWDEAFRLLRERGITSTVSWIHCANGTSRRSHERMGATRVGWLVLLDVFGYKTALASIRPFLRFAGPGKRIYVPVQASVERAGAKAHGDVARDAGAAGSDSRG